MCMICVMGQGAYGRGCLKVDVKAEDGRPLKDAKVAIADSAGQELCVCSTDCNGQTICVQLDAPDKSTAQKHGGMAYAVYTVTIEKEGYITQIIEGAEVFDGVASTQPATLRQGFARSGEEETIDIPFNALKQASPQIEQKGPPDAAKGARILQNVVIPQKITVHMGVPNNASAKNISVGFADYVKNVTASEIYANWPPAAIEANVYAIISLALNRIYTEWYRSRGYNFDITNSTQYDQYYKEGQTIPDNISRVVDRVFNRYIRRVGHKEPFFSSFCNGTTSKCPGMSQWGTVSLANAGYSPINILKYYYGNDIELATANIVSDTLTSYPGYTLSQGSQGPDVEKIQEYLNRISADFPAIPKVTPDGWFGPSTAAAVKAFQKSQNLSQTGVVDRATWNKISFIYTAVTDLAELTSEGQHVGIGANPPSSIVSQGSKGKDVVELQFLLNAIGSYYDSIPALLRDGTFGPATTAAVKAFQTQFGMKADGIVGPATWNKLYEVYKSLGLGIGGGGGTGGGGGGTGGGDGGGNGDGGSGGGAVNTPPYPGTALRKGSRGSDVERIQSLMNAISNTHPSIPKVIVDGVFGSRTEEQVVAFQRHMGLSADGIVGPATWNAIMNEYSADAPNAPAPNAPLPPPSVPIPPPSTPAPPPPSAPPYPGKLLKQGSRGEDVRVLQTYLNKWANIDSAIPRIKVDGVFGKATKAAVVAAQRGFGLARDGIVGPKTWNAVVK